MALHPTTDAYCLELKDVLEHLPLLVRNFCHAIKLHCNTSSRSRRRKIHTKFALTGFFLPTTAVFFTDRVEPAERTEGAIIWRKALPGLQDGTRSTEGTMHDSSECCPFLLSRPKHFTVHLVEDLQKIASVKHVPFEGVGLSLFSEWHLNMYYSSRAASGQRISFLNGYIRFWKSHQAIWRDANDRIAISRRDWAHLILGNTEILGPITDHE